MVNVFVLAPPDMPAPNGPARSCPPSPAPPEQPVARLAAAPQANNPFILIVDDEPAILNVMRLTLKAAGYRVLTAISAEEALRVCENAPDPIGLLISDVLLPGMKGPALCWRLRQRHPELRCLLVSGLPADMLDEFGIDPGGLDLLAKPWTIPQFLERIDRILAG